MTSSTLTSASPSPAFRRPHADTAARAAHAVPQQSPRSTPADADPYASVAETKTVLAGGAQFRSARLEATDMLTTDDAAELARTSRVTINAWIKAGRAIGVAHLRRGFKLPRWQFEEPVFVAIRSVSEALGSRDGWTLLRFFETPQGALDGISPRQALEQGVTTARIVKLATAEAH